MAIGLEGLVTDYGEWGGGGRGYKMGGGGM